MTWRFDLTCLCNSSSAEIGVGQEGRQLYTLIAIQHTSPSSGSPEIASEESLHMTWTHLGETLSCRHVNTDKLSFSAAFARRVMVGRRFSFMPVTLCVDSRALNAALPPFSSSPPLPCCTSSLSLSTVETPAPPSGEQLMFSCSCFLRPSVLVMECVRPTFLSHPLRRSPEPLLPFGLNLGVCAAPESWRISHRRGHVVSQRPASPSHPFVR